MAIRVLIVDDSVTIRAMMSRVLASDPDINIVGIAASAAAAEGILGSESVDVVTLDVEMPGMSGIDYLAILTARAIPVVMLSGSTALGDAVRTRAFIAGAAGCFAKADAVRESGALIKLLKAAANHEAPISRKDAAAVAKALH